MKKAIRPLILVGLLALSSGLIGYSVTRVKYQVGEFKISELEVNEYSLGEQIGRDAKGNLMFTLAPSFEPREFARVACADPSVAIAAMESSLLIATDTKKPAAKKPSATAPKKPAPKKPTAKTPAPKKPAAEKPAPKKPTPGGKACPT